MKRNAAYAAVICLLACPAFAGGMDRGSGPSGSASSSAALSSARSASRASAASSSSAVGGSASSRAAGGSTGPVTVTQQAVSGGGYRDGNVPDAVPPSIAGGNVCSVGGSAGLSLAGIGLAGGYSGEARNCVLRQNAALLYNMGDPAAAKDMLCQDARFAAAFAESRHPCDADKYRWTREGYHENGDGSWTK